MFKTLKKYFDLKLTLLLAGFYAIFEVIYFVKTFYGRFFNGKDPWLDIVIGDYLLDYVIVVGFMQIIAMSTKAFIKRKISWKKIFLIHLSLSLLIGVLIRIISDIYIVIIHDFDNYNPTYSFARFLSVIDYNFLIYSAMISIIYSYYYFKELKESEIKQIMLESQLSSMRMKVLNSQLQPHFFFNTLNCISSLIEFDTKKAQKTLVDLSEFFRQVLLTRNKVFVTLEKELEILGYYLNILRVRFSDNLVIEEVIDPNLLSQEVPVLLLQPLIENSIQHGYSYEYPEIEVKVEISSNEDYIFLKVMNNGAPLKVSALNSSQSMGVSNIRERLTNLYDKDFEFIVRNRKDREGVESIIKIPKV